MKNTWYRGILILAVILFTAIHCYPTIGWLALSDEAKAERLARWKQEDSVYEEPNFFRQTAKGIKRWAQFDRDSVVTLGLDLQGGVHMVVGFDLTEEQKERGFDEEATQQLVLQRIRRRVNEFEAKEPIIQTLGTNKIQIQLPGEKDVDRAIALIKKTAYLSFHLVAGHDETVNTFTAISANPKFENRFTPFLKAPTMKGGPFRVPEEYVGKIADVMKEIEEEEGLLPEGKILALSQPPAPWDEERYYELYLMDKEMLLSGEGLRMAVARPDEQNPGKSMILFEFAGQAANKFAEATGQNVGRNMAIVIDGVVCSAPNIRERIAGSGQITGNFTDYQAMDLAIALNSGSMPVPIYEEYTGVVGPSLGADSIRKGVMASLFGFLAVVVFMLIYYRVGGIIANIALLLNGFIMLAAFAYFDLTLTLPGIAGFVLTLGMAVDANVLIFERVREEVRNGKSLKASIDLGYQRATVTILDANITTLIAALVLLQFGTGPIKGFGTALAIGLCTSVFTALVVTKAIFDLLLERSMVSKFNMMTLIKPDLHIPFIEHRRKAFIASLVLILVGFGVFFARGYSNNLGVDFAGGTNITVSLNTDKKVDIGEVRQALTDAGFLRVVVQEYGQSGDLTTNQFSIRTSELQEDAAEQDVGSRVRAALAPLVGQGAGSNQEAVSLDRMETVGPAIGKQLRRDAAEAIFYALIFMIAYMWFRFNLTYGITAIIALFHDSLVALGMLAVLGVVLSALSMWGGHIDMTVIAAILTIIGYSVNDTVVVFDRIREDTRLYTGRGMTLGQIIDIAINQTLARSLLTSFTTLLSVFMLLVFGGEVLRDFAFCLMVGVFIGTYSSIFIASALAYTWMTYLRQRQLHASGKGGDGGKGGGPKGGKKKANSKKKPEAEATA